MKIELFLHSIYQEFPARNEQKDFELYDLDFCPFDKWVNDYWAINRNIDVKLSKNQIIPKTLDQVYISSAVQLRKELFGGILYDKESNAVFKLDNDAFKVCSLLVSGKSLSDVQQCTEFDIKGIETLKLSLLKYGLCTI